MDQEERITDALKIKKIKAERIVSGLHEYTCPDILAHAILKKVGKHRATYCVYAQAYLPRLNPDFPGPIINILREIQPVVTEVDMTVEDDLKKNKIIGKRKRKKLKKVIDKSLAARTVQITYTSKRECQPPYSLWSFYVEYKIKKSNSVPFIKINLRNTDPETTRGTVTTVQDSNAND